MRKVLNIFLVGFLLIGLTGNLIPMYGDKGLVHLYDMIAKSRNFEFQGIRPFKVVDPYDGSTQYYCEVSVRNTDLDSGKANPSYAAPTSQHRWQFYEGAELYTTMIPVDNPDDCWPPSSYAMLSVRVTMLWSVPLWPLAAGIALIFVNLRPKKKDPDGPEAESSPKIAF